MQRRVRGISAVELLVLVACVVMVFSIVVPAMMATSTRVLQRVCEVNLKAIGQAAAIYAQDHDGSWMVPAHRPWVPENPSATVDYTFNPGGGLLGPVGFQPDRGRESKAGAFGSSRVSVTRAFWMLVRSGDLSPKQFVCPYTADDIDPSRIDLYYDFSSINNISYGYQVPFGPAATRARSSADPNKVLAADKSPFYTFFQGPANWQNGGESGHELRASDPWTFWRGAGANSPNHARLGQNVLYADGRVSWKRKPIAGVDQDNIYTLMTSEFEPPPGTPINIIWGSWVHDFASGVGWNPFPGAFTLAPQHSSTDSLIYP